MTNDKIRPWVTAFLRKRLEDERSGAFRDAWIRLFTWNEGELVYKSIKRNLNQKRSMHWDFFIDMLMMQARNWESSWQYDLQLRPTQRFELVQSAAQLARQLRAQLAQLGVSWKAHDFLTDEQLKADLISFLKVFSIEEEVEVTSKIYFEGLTDRFRTIASDFFLESTLFNVYALLGVLSDQKVLLERAQDSILSKVDSPTSKRVFFIRNLSAEIFAITGKPLEETVANAAAVLLNDRSIDRDTVRSALKSYSAKEPTEKNAFYDMNLQIRRNVLENP